jgi:hypothetical protein
VVPLDSDRLCLSRDVQTPLLGRLRAVVRGEQQPIIRQMAAMDQNVLNYSTKGLRTDGEECMSIESLVCLPRLR